MRASVFTLSLLCALPIHAESTEPLDVLRARSSEQERQIRTLESEIETLHGQLALERRRSRATSLVSSAAVPPVKIEAKSYVVTTGDTLSSIAREHRSSVADLMKANEIKDPTRIRAGQRIALPSGPVAAPSTPFFKKTPPKAVPVSEEEAKIAPVANTPLAKPVPHGIKNYKVQRGDTLYGIARRHSLSVETIRALNPDVEDRILVGQQIAVQQPVDRKAPATTSTTMAANPQKRPSSETITYKPIQTNNRSIKKPPAKTETSDRPKASPKPILSTVDLKPGRTKPVIAPKRIASVFVSEEVTFGDFAKRHGTTPEQLNALNGWDFRGSLLLAKGSEIYVPGS